MLTTLKNIFSAIYKSAAILLFGYAPMLLSDKNQAFEALNAPCPNNVCADIPGSISVGDGLFSIGGLSMEESLFSQNSVPIFIPLPFDGDHFMIDDGSGVFTYT